MKKQNSYYLHGVAFDTLMTSPAFKPIGTRSAGTVNSKSLHNKIKQQILHAWLVADLQQHHLDGLHLQRCEFVHLVRDNFGLFFLWNLKFINLPDFVDPDQQIELLELHLVVVAALSQDHDRADGVADLREAHYAVLLKCELIFEVVP